MNDLKIQTIASRALGRCAAAASTWTRHTVAEKVTRIVTEHGVRATPTELRDLVTLVTDLAVGDCLSVLPPGTAQPEHVAHLTSVQVIAAEMRLRDLLTARAGIAARSHSPNVTALAAESGSRQRAGSRRRSHRIDRPAGGGRGRSRLGKDDDARRRDRCRCCGGSRHEGRDADEEGRRRRRP